jgi:hypothetical protein
MIFLFFPIFSCDDTKSQREENAYVYSALLDVLVEEDCIVLKLEKEDKKDRSRRKEVNVCELGLKWQRWQRYYDGLEVVH